MSRTQLKVFLTLILMMTLMCCKAQQIYPLNADYEEVSQNSYLKDLDNELLPYVGTYKANFNGNEIMLYIDKQQQKLEKTAQKNYYIDALIVKYIVKNSSGIILQDTQNNITDVELYSISTRPAQNAVHFFL